MFFFKKLLPVAILLIIISAFFGFYSVVFAQDQTPTNNFLFEYQQQDQGQVNTDGTGQSGTLNRLIQKVKSILNLIIELLFALATVYFMWGVVTYIAGAGNTEKLETGKKHMLWGIIGMAIMASAWSIVKIIQSSLLSI